MKNNVLSTAASCPVLQRHPSQFNEESLRQPRCYRILGRKPPLPDRYSFLEEAARRRKSLCWKWLKVWGRIFKPPLWVHLLLLEIVDRTMRTACNTEKARYSEPHYRITYASLAL